MSQGDVSGDGTAQTSERGSRPDRADLCADDRRPASIPKEPRGRMLCGVATRAEELRRQRATAAHQQGDKYLRTLLVQGAHYILGPFGEDSDLRRWGRKLAERGEKT